MQCTYTHTRDTVRCAPLELLSIILCPSPRFTSFLLFYFRALPQQLQNRTLDGTPNKCLNIYFYINRNIFLGFLFFVFPYRIYYSPFSMRACFVGSLIEFSLLRSAFVSFSSALSFSLYLSLSINCILLICQNILPNTHTHKRNTVVFSRYVLDQQFTDLSHVSRFVKISVKISIIL